MAELLNIMILKFFTKQINKLLRLNRKLLHLSGERKCTDIKQ